MTTRDYIKKIKRNLDAVKSGKPVAIAAQDTHVQMVERIFEKGQNANNGKIGEYDDSKPLYVNPKYSPKKLATTGKNGKSKFKNGKKKQTRYYKSYKEFRQKMGRPTDRVNFRLTGLLQSDFGKGVRKKDTYTYISAISNEDNKDKLYGLQKKYGRVFSLTPKERTLFKQVLARETFKLLQ